VERVVLAFSGGLGTVASLHLLKRRFGGNVITFTANLGQKGSTEFLCERATRVGATSAHIADLRQKFVTHFLWPAVRAGAVCDSGYALAHALARPLIVEQLVMIAREEGAQFVAHGCAGKSNDQVRFEAAAASLAPDLQVIAPLRDHGLLRLDELVEYCRKHRLPTKNESAARFSITENLYGSSIQWQNAPDPYADVPDDAFRRTKPLDETPAEATELVLGFEEGLPVSIDGGRLSPVNLLTQLADVAGEHGVGRLVTVEDRLIGIKMVEVYEQPAATAIHAARNALMRIVLSPGLLTYLPQASRTYADLVYQGLWYSELREALDAFFLKSNEYVTGDVRLSFHKGVCSVKGVRSQFSLYSQGLAATTTQGDSFSHESVRGYLETISQALKVPPREGGK
jgi:argininosuccinate synthase